jgi:hypothetical protein
MIYAMTVAILFLVFFILALAALRHWVRHDRFASTHRPSIFD